MKKWLLLALLGFTLVACEDESKTLYSTSGKVEETDCDRAFNYIILDNGIKYKLKGAFGNAHCKLQNGISVELIHTSDLTVEEVILIDSKVIE